MSQGKLGFRIFDMPKKIERNIIEEFLKIPSPNVGDAMGRMRVIGASELMPIIPGSKLVGRAITVFSMPGDNLMFHKALEMAESGDVIVINCSKDTNHSGWGGLMTRAAAKKGIGGLVIDGAVRDIADIRECNFPVFAKSISGGGCFKEGPGEINCNIAIGHLSVSPGDLIIADDDGVTIVPYADIEETLIESKKVVERETKRVKEIGEGDIYNNTIDETLKRKGVI